MEKIQIPEINNGEEFFIGRITVLASEELEKLGKNKDLSNREKMQMTIYAILLCSKGIKTKYAKPDPQYYQELKNLSIDFPIAEAESFIKTFWGVNETFLLKAGIPNPFKNVPHSDTLSPSLLATPSSTS